VLRGADGLLQLFGFEQELFLAFPSFAIQQVFDLLFFELAAMRCIYPTVFQLNKMTGLGMPDSLSRSIKRNSVLECFVRALIYATKPVRVVNFQSAPTGNLINRKYAYTIRQITLPVLILTLCWVKRY
jgi:hypothetical protein